MARSPILSFVLFGALALLGKRTVENFVGATQTRRGSLMTRRAEEEEKEEKVAAPGDRLKLKVRRGEIWGRRVVEKANLVTETSGDKRLGCQLGMVTKSTCIFEAYPVLMPARSLPCCHSRLYS